MKFTIEINHTVNNTARFHSHIEAESLEDALQIVNSESGHELNIDQVFQATNYHNPSESSWSQEVIDARASRFERNQF